MPDFDASKNFEVEVCTRGYVVKQQQLSATRYWNTWACETLDSLIKLIRSSTVPSTDINAVEEVLKAKAPEYPIKIEEDIEGLEDV